MNAMTKLNETKDKKRSHWVVIAACAIGGGAIGYAGARLLRLAGDGEPSVIDLSTFAAVLVGVMLIMCMAIVGICYSFPKVGIAMKMIEDIEQWEDERTMHGLSCLGGFAYGLALIMLALAEPMGMVGNAWLLAALGGLAVLITYTSVRLLREYDELWQGVNSESSVIAFYMTLIVGGVWSVLAHLNFIPALAPLDWITLMTAACVVGAVVAAQKRGMLED